MIHHLTSQTSPPPNIPNLPSSPHIPQIAQYLAHSPVQIAPIPTQRPVTRSQHGIFKPNKKYGLHTHVVRSPLPRNPMSALNDPNWKMSMDDEYNALIKNKIWELVSHPPDVNIIQSMWIFRHKEKSNGSFERHKARLLDDGKTQQVGVDYGETFSLVVNPVTVRTVLCIAFSNGWPLHQLDVKNAFLHGELKETVYMHQLMGYRDLTFPLMYVC